MKWLIFIIFFSSCGKHVEPNKIDLSDSDGDQILNVSDEDKYVANNESTIQSRGRIKFNNGVISEIPFSSDRFLNQSILSLITQNSKKEIDQSDFSKLSKIKLLRSEKLKKSNLNNHTIRFYFDTNHSTSDEVVMINSTMVTSLGFWEKNKKISLSTIEFEDILSGKSHFAIKKKDQKNNSAEARLQDSIHHKTYKVYFYDGMTNKVLHISNDLDFNLFKEQQNIRSITIKKAKDLLLNMPEKSLRKWYSRKLNNNTYVLANLDEADAYQSLSANFVHSKILLKRTKGTPQNTLKLNNKFGALVLLRIKQPQQIAKAIQIASNKDKTITFIGKKMSTSCYQFFKNSLKDKTYIHNFEFLMKNMKNLNILRKYILENIDTNKVYWELLSDELPENFNISFVKALNLSRDQYLNTCFNPKIPPQTLYIESNLTVEIESFVEKIPDSY